MYLYIHIIFIYRFTSLFFKFQNKLNSVVYFFGDNTVVVVPTFWFDKENGVCA